MYSSCCASPKWPPTTPVPSWSWILQKGVPGRAAHLRDATLPPSVSVLISTAVTLFPYSRSIPLPTVPRTSSVQSGVCHTDATSWVFLSKMMNKDLFTFFILYFLVMHFPRNITYSLVQPKKTQVSAWVSSTFPMPSIHPDKPWVSISHVAEILLDPGPILQESEGDRDVFGLLPQSTDHINNSQVGEKMRCQRD